MLSPRILYLIQEVVLAVLYTFFQFGSFSGVVEKLTERNRRPFLSQRGKQNVLTDRLPT